MAIYHSDPTGEAAIRKLCFQIGTRLLMLGLTGTFLVIIILGA